MAGFPILSRTWIVVFGLLIVGCASSDLPLRPFDISLRLLDISEPHSLLLDRRQTTDVPPNCLPFCGPVNSHISAGCTPSTCCNQPFLNAYVDCYKCVASEIGLFNHIGAQNVVRSIAQQCLRNGIILQEPFLPTNGPLSPPPPGATPIIPGPTTLPAPITSSSTAFTPSSTSPLPLPSSTSVSSLSSRVPSASGPPGQPTSQITIGPSPTGVPVSSGSPSPTSAPSQPAEGSAAGLIDRDGLALRLGLGMSLIIFALW